MVTCLMLSIIAVLAFLCISHAIPEMMSRKLAKRPPAGRQELPTPQE